MAQNEWESLQGFSTRKRQRGKTGVISTTSKTPTTSYICFGDVQPLIEKWKE